MESRTIPPGHASARQTEMGERFNRVLFSALDALESQSIPFALIGGIAASGLGRPRSTHDIDIFVRPEDADAALEALGKGGFEIEKTDPRWLYKGWMEDQMVDIIFKSQGDIYFDNEMSSHARKIHFHGRDIPAVAPEDLLIIKAAVHAEVGPHHWHDALAILSHANLDWQYLMRRARRAARRVLALLIYAQSNDIWIPNNVIHELFSGIFGQNPNKNQPEPHKTFASQQQPAPAPQAPQAQAAASPKHLETYMVGHILDKLATDGRTAANDLQLSVGGKKILVKGEVLSKDQRIAIEEVIQELAVGFEIDNQVRVTEVTAPQAEAVV